MFSASRVLASRYWYLVAILPVNKFSAFYRIRIFTCSFTTNRHWTMFSASRVLTASSYPIPSTSVLILDPPYNPACIFQLVSLTASPRLLNINRSNSLLCGHHSHIWQKLQIMETIAQLFEFSSEDYFLPSGSTYSSKQLVMKHP
jgi:hypothetical protein